MIGLHNFFRNVLKNVGQDTVSGIVHLFKTRRRFLVLISVSCSMSKCHYSFGRCRRPKWSYYCSRENYIAAQTPGASRKSMTSHVYATRPPCRHIFRDAHFEIVQFCLFVSSVSSFFVYRFSIHLFIVSLSSFLSVSFWVFFCRDSASQLEQHALAPKFRAEVALCL
jgi:hypothetical protein